jgi:hypothetical protein
MKSWGIVHVTALGTLLIAAACEERGVAGYAWTAWVGGNDGPDLQGRRVVALDSRGNSSVVNLAHETPQRVLKGVILDVSRVRKLDPDGRVLWHADIGLPSDSAHAVDLVIDPEDGVVVLGQAPPWIARIDRGGTLTMPAKVFDGVDRATKLAVDAQHNVVVVGDTVGEQPDYPSDIAVVKLSVDGEPIWTNTIDTAKAEYATAVAVDEQGGVLVGAEVGWPPPAGDVLFQRYDANGVARFRAPVIFATELHDFLTGVAILPDDSFMALGSTGWDGLGPSAAWMMHYRADGVAQWQRPMVLTATEVQHPFEGADHPTTSFPSYSDRAKEGAEYAYASADAIALDPAGHPIVIGARGASVWLQHFEPRDGILGPCGGGSTRCSVPTIYERGSRWPSHRGLAIDADGSMLLVGDPFELDPAAHVSPMGGVWLGKLSSHEFSHEND